MEEFEKISEKMKEGILCAETLAEILDDMRSRLPGLSLSIEMEYVDEIDRLKTLVREMLPCLNRNMPVTDRLWEEAKALLGKTQSD